jgi:hypothetical protein
MEPDAQSGYYDPLTTKVTPASNMNYPGRGIRQVHQLPTVTGEFEQSFDRYSLQVPESE